MCDPVTIGAMALGTAGSIYKGKEAADTQNAMIGARNAATQQELERSKKYSAESQGEFDKSLNIFDPQNQATRLQTNQNAATSGFNINAPTQAGVGTIGTGNAPAVVGRNEQAGLGDVFRRINDRGAAHGKLAGYDQTTFDNNVDLTGQARRIDSIGDYAKVSSGVNKTEQEAAYKNAYRNPSPLGDILQTAGQVGAFYGGKGGLPGGSGNAFMPSQSFMNNSWGY